MDAKPIFIPITDNGGGDIKANTALCLMAGFSGRNVHIVRSSDSHPSRGGNKIVADFLESECDVLLWIDGDIHFTQQHIAFIMEHDEPLVFGIYPKGQDDTPPCLCTFEEGSREYKGHLLEVRRAGRGFMRVHRTVFEAMKEDNGGPALHYHNHGRPEWDFFQNGVVEGDFSAYPSPQREWLSEDWYFCEQARYLGFKVLIDRRVMLSHEKSKVYSFAPKQMDKKEDEQRGN